MRSHTEYLTFSIPARLAFENITPQVEAAVRKSGEDGADTHLKCQIMGREVVVAITAGRLDFEPWEQIFYGEFDGNGPLRTGHEDTEARRKCQLPQKACRG